MKILHLPNSFLPWTTGGTETYTLGLAKALRKVGIESIFCLHSKSNNMETIGEHFFEDFKVTVLPEIKGGFNRLSVYTREYDNIPEFELYLNETKPDLVHFHDLSGGSSISHLKVVKGFGIPTVLTYHSPGQSCPQRALRFHNSVICDGRLELNRCSTCLIVSKRIPAILGPMIQVFGTKQKIKNTDSALKRIITLPTSIDTFIASFNKAIQLLDKVHVHAKWVEDLFIINKVPKSKIFFAQTAGPDNILKSFSQLYSDPKEISSTIIATFSKDRPLKIVFVGRCDYVKGVHILIEAVLLLPKTIPIEIHFIGPYWESIYALNLLSKIKGDLRFKTPELLPYNEVALKLSQMDVMIVPSLWPETGPLSLLEGLAAGLPIIGSNCGGIPEWVNDGVNGLLFNQGDAHQLMKKIEWVLNNPEEFKKLKNHAKLTRTMDDLAFEMKSLYENLIQQNNLENHIK